jgi:hypothetical protein
MQCIATMKVAKYIAPWSVAPWPEGTGDRAGPPLLLRPVGNLVMLSECSWSSIPAYTQARRVLVEKKCYERIRNFNVSSGNFFNEKSRRGVGEKRLSFPVEFVGKILLLPPKKHGTHDATVRDDTCEEHWSSSTNGSFQKRSIPPTEEIENNPLPPSDILEWFVLPPSPDVKFQNYPPPLRTSTISKFF